MTDSHKNKLTLIKRSVPYCPKCIDMQTALESENIPFDTIDIAHEPEAVEKYGLSSVPVMFIDGENGQIRLNGVQSVGMVRELLE